MDRNWRDATAYPYACGVNRLFMTALKKFVRTGYANVCSELGDRINRTDRIGERAVDGRSRNFSQEVTKGAKRFW